MTKNYIVMQAMSLVGTYSNRGLTLVEGEGAYLRDQAGESYLDLMTNYGVNIFGHCHPELTECLTAQLRRLTTLHGSFANDMRAEAARALVLRCGGGLARVYLSNSGTEANEAALKFAVLATGRKKFIRCQSGYHGKTLGALSATDGEKFRAAFEPLLWDFGVVPYNDPDALGASLDGRTAGLIVEPVQGEGGIHLPDPGYLKKAKELCASRGALLILDEVQSGMGRLGTFLASQPEGIGYDILTLGKGLAGGIPVGATLVSAAVAERIPKSSHTSTFGGNPLAAAGILAALRILDDGMLSHVQEMGDCFLRGLKRLELSAPVKAKGKGLMLGLEVGSSRDGFLKRLQEERILAIPAADNVVRFLPPYIIQKEQINWALNKIEKVFVPMA